MPLQDTCQNHNAPRLPPRKLSCRPIFWIMGLPGACMPFVDCYRLALVSLSATMRPPDFAHTISSTALPNDRHCDQTLTTQILPRNVLQAAVVYAAPPSSIISISRSDNTRDWLSLVPCCNSRAAALVPYLPVEQCVAVRCEAAAPSPRQASWAQVRPHQHDYYDRVGGGMWARLCAKARPRTPRRTT